MILSFSFFLSESFSEKEICYASHAAPSSYLLCFRVHGQVSGFWECESFQILFIVLLSHLYSRIKINNCAKALHTCNMIKLLFDYHLRKRTIAFYLFHCYC